MPDPEFPHAQSMTIPGAPVLERFERITVENRAVRKTERRAGADENPSMGTNLERLQWAYRFRRVSEVTADIRVDSCSGFTGVKSCRSMTLLKSGHNPHLLAALGADLIFRYRCESALNGNWCVL
jgi:hypothetical protein